MRPIFFSINITSSLLNVFRSRVRQCHSVNKWHRPEGSDTGIYVYNCIAKGKVPLVLKDNTATWYSCGPTVYDSAHIGHASCYVKLDIVQRILTKYFGIHLITCMGITDVDDKIIRKCRIEGTDMASFTRRMETEFWKNLSDLGVLKPDFIVRVSEHIPEIINFVKVLKDKGLGYDSKDGSVYFNTATYRKYGKLHIPSGSGEESDEKQYPSDFALWKGHKDGEPHWTTEWGNGRPGWHIECSAMASRLFGSSVDVHTGGIDLKFPHHENEEAQSCAFHSRDQWVNYWLHVGHLHLRKQAKMSKSLGNTISVDDALQRYGAEAFRMTCLSSHYNSSMEWDDETVKNANAVLAKVKSFLAECVSFVSNNKHGDLDGNKLLESLKQVRKDIDESLRDDFDTPRCLKHISDLIKETNRLMNSSESASKKSIDGISARIAVAVVSKFVKNIFETFGMCLEMEKSADSESRHFAAVVDELVDFRKVVRKRALETKDEQLLKECDGVRNSLASLKIHVNDKREGASWSVR